MSVTKKTYELDLKIDKLISNYKKAIQTMRSEGATDKTLAPFEKKLVSIETELLRLQKVGKEGIPGNPQSIQAYERELQNAYKRLERLGDGLSISAKNSKNFTNAITEAKRELNKLNGEAKKAENSFTKSLQGLGFDKNTASNIASTVKSEEDLNNKLKEELQLRQKNLQRAETAARVAQDWANKQAAGRFGQNLIQGQSGSASSLTSASMASLKQYLTDEDRNVEKYKKTSEVFQHINAELSQMIAAGKDFSEIWTQLNILSEKFFERPADEAFGDVQAITGRIRQATDAREKIYRGTDAYRDLNEAFDSAKIIQNETNIKSVTQAYSNLTEQQNAAAAASRKLREAEAETERKMSNLNVATNWLAGATRAEAQANREQADSLLESARAAKRTSEQFEQLKSHILMFFSVTSVVSLFRQQIRQTFEDVKTLDKSFASIAMVTANSVSEMWGHYNQYATMAQELGQRTQSVIDASALFYQQGLDTNEALELTADTMKLATLAGIDYSQATDEMTAAIRGFRMEMDQGSHVTDVYSTLAASAAASVNEIAQAMVRTSSIANSAGMSFENTAAFLTQMIETTQESAENIGTSMKTIIARFTELKENVAGTDESEFQDLDLNRVDTALKSVGIQLKDTTGQFRDLDDVFIELSSIWGTLDRNTQRYVATIAAGSRQQSRFLALMDGYERNVELMEIAADSTGQADKQFAKYMDTMEFRLNTLATKWEQLRVSILNENFFKELAGQGSELLDKALDLDPKKAFVMTPIAILAAGNFVKVFMENIKTGFEQSAGLAGLIGENLSRDIAKKIGQTDTFSATQYIEGKIQKKVAPKENKIQHLTEETQELTKQRDLLQEKRNNIQAAREAEQSYIEKLEMDTVLNSGMMAKSQERIEILKQETAELKEQRENTIALRTESKQYLNDIEDQKAKLLKEINTIERDISNRTRTVNTIKEGRRPNKYIIQQESNSIVQQQNLLNKKQEEYNRLQQRSVVMQKAFKQNLEEGARLTTQINQNENQIKVKEQEIITLQQANTSNTEFKAMAEKQVEQILEEEVFQLREQENVQANLVRKTEQLTAEEDKRNKIINSTFNKMKMGAAELFDRAGGIPTLLTGIGNGIQSISSNLVIMGSMAISGADAVDTLNVGLTSMVMMGASQLIPTIKGVVEASQAYNLAMENNLAAGAIRDYGLKKGAKSLADFAAQEGAATGATEAATVAQNAHNASMAAAISLYSLLAVAAVALVAALAMWAINEAKAARESALLKTTIGQATKNIEENKEALQDTSEELTKLSTAVKEAKDSYDLFAEAQENYKDKAYLTEEEQASWLDLQQKIAEQQPWLIASYDDEGNAILDLAATWNAATEAKQAYYEASLEESKKALEGAQYEKKIAEEETEIVKDAGNSFGKLKGIAETAKQFTQKNMNLFGWWFGQDTTNRFNTSGELVLPYVTDSAGIAHFFSALRGQDPEEFSQQMYLIAEAFAEYDQEFKDIKNKPDEVFNKLWEKSKNQDWMENVWAEAWTSINDKFYEGLVKSSEKGFKAAEAKMPAYVKKVVSDTVRLSNFGIEDKSVQDLVGQMALDLVGNTEGLSPEELSRKIEEALGNIALTSEQKNKIKAVKEKFRDDVLKQYEELAKLLGPDADGILAAFRNIYAPEFELRQANAETFTKIFVGEGGEANVIDETGQVVIEGLYSTEKEHEILDYYNTLGEESRQAFLDGYQKLVDKDIKKEDAKAYAEDFAKIALDFSKDSDVQGYIQANFNPEEINSLNYEQQKSKFAAELTKLSSDFSTIEAETLFEQLYNNAKNHISPIFTQLTESSYRAAIEGVEKIGDVLTSHNKVLQKYVGYAENSIITLSETEGKEIDKLIKDLYDPDKGGLSQSLFEGILDFNEENNQYTYNAGKLLKIIQTYGTDILDKAERTNYFTGSELSNIQSLNAQLKISVGLFRSIEDTIGGLSNLTSSFSSAASEQIKEGYLSSKSVQSLVDSANAAGLNGAYIAGNFINDALQLNYEGLYNYIDSQIVAMEKSSNMAKANEDQIKVWQALKKELYMSKLELEEEAEETNEAEEALEKYNDQLKDVEEKQKALNKALEEFNDFLYGDQNRSSGLDKLYNYQKELEHYNDEISRSKDLLSDAETIQDATMALQRYSAATHDSIRYEKARQEAIRRGLAEQEAQLNNFAYSYSNPEGGPTANIRFSDYIRKDSTGLYSLNQALLDRAQFNDKFKELLEQQVDEYNKYAEELLKSEDSVRKMEKEFQEQRAAAVKAYASLEKNLADALKNNYQEEVDALKEKYDSMKEADDEYLGALTDAIEKQKKLRERESKYTDLSKKEKKLSLISRDTSGAQELQRRQLEQEIEKDRESLLDDAISDVIDGMKELYEQQEENRTVEIELKEALIDNTGFWYSQAEGFAASFETAEDYMEFMSNLDKEFAESTLAMREDQLNTWREEYQGAIQYNAMQAMDVTSETGDFIVDTINVTGDEVARTVAETSDAYASEVINAYNSTTQAFQEDMEKQIESINNARDALDDAIKKLQEYAEEARKAAEAYNVVPSGIVAASEENPYADWAPRNVAAPTGGDNGGTVPSNVIDNLLDNEANNVVKVLDGLGMRDQIHFRDKISLLSYLNQNKDTIDEDQIRHALKKLGVSATSLTYAPKESLFNQLINKVSAFKTGGLVDYTGPAWVDGTKTSPEAFLNPEDTKRIGEAARILADLPFFNSYGEAENINNTAGDISIEINLNIDKISSETDIDEMLDRVKEEIVSTARSVGTNTILQQ